MADALLGFRAGGCGGYRGLGGRGRRQERSSAGVISGAAVEIAAGPVWRKEGGRALPAVIRTQGALLEGRAAWGEAGWWALRNWEVHGAEERGGRFVTPGL